MSNLSLPDIGQYSVNVTGRGTAASPATLIASFAGPVRIVNINLTAIIWLADNPSVRDGNGMPLAPGTSLVWTGSQSTNQIWAALGQDTQSLTVSSAQVVIGAPAQDVQPNPIATAIAILNSGLILIDNPVVLENFTLISNGSFLKNYDVTKYQTIDIFLSVANVAVQQSFAIDFQDPAGTQTIFDNQYLWAANDAAALNVSLPVRGGNMRVTFAGLNPSTVNLMLIGSTRPWTAPHSNSIQNRVLGAVTATPGANISTIITPNFRYDGLVRFGCQMQWAALVGADALQVQVNDVVTGQNVYSNWVHPQAITNIPAIAWLPDVFMAPRNTWTFQTVNRSAAASTSHHIELVAIQSTQ